MRAVCWQEGSSWQRAHLILPNSHESNADVAQDAVAHAAGGEGHLVQGHAIHLNGRRVLALFKVDVAHVDAQQMSLHSSCAS